jgi:hypothetical protein
MAGRMPYQVRRTKNRHGVGPLRVFRALPPEEARKLVPGTPVELRGDDFARRALTVSGLGQEPPVDLAEAATAAVCAKRDRREFVDVAWAELAYESVRRQVRPAAPSRAASTFASLDPFEALSFRELSGIRYVVFPGYVPAGVRWAVADMFKYAVPAFEPTVAAATDAYRSAQAKARQYWDGPITGRAEVLVDGPIRIIPSPIRLMEVLRRAGILGDQQLRPGD